jgi:hypothetical protein
VDLDAYRTRAERDEVPLRQIMALGATIINYASNAAVVAAARGA